MNPEDLKQRQWRIKIKSDDGGAIRYEEPFAGNWPQALRRAWIMWARTSFIVNKRANQQNRDVYASLEVWDEKTGQYKLMREKRGRLLRNAKAPAAS